MAKLKIGNKNIAKKMLGTKEVIKEVLNGITIYEKVVGENYITFSSSTSFTLKVVDNQKYWDGTLEYSTDTETWKIWSGTRPILSGSNNKLYIRGTGNTYITGSSASDTKAKWVLTGSNISCSGNIETLLDYQTVANGNHPIMSGYCYKYMFYNCTSLTTTPNLPATTLANFCYYYMFKGCTSLTTAPNLPATTLNLMCYAGMFADCTSLYVSDTQTTDAPYAWRIPTSGTFTNTYSQGSMFNNCLGTRASNSMAGASGQSYTYYTQNPPVGD